jgi:probable rRNA maturation factor
VKAEPAPLILDLQIATAAGDLPARADLERWTGAAVAAGAPNRDGAAELTIRIVDAAEGAALNQRYRGREGPTNVLSFPFEAPAAIAGLAEPGTDALGALIGDLVICAPVVAREAAAQGKPGAAHWAHMVVHGVLHLLGHDHIDPGEAARMEALETVILAGLGFPPPYEVPTDTHDERPK